MNEWDRFGETWLIVLRTLLSSSTQTGEDCCSLCCRLVGRQSVALLAWCDEFCWVFGGDVSAGCRDISLKYSWCPWLAVYATCLLWRTRSVCGQPQLAKFNRREVVSDTSDVFGNCRQVLKLSRRSWREVGPYTSVFNATVNLATGSTANIFPVW